MILCCGEAVVDMLPVPADQNAPTYQALTGGAAVNTAIALARLDQQVGFFGGLSRDHFGSLLARTMARESVSTTHACMSDAPTTLAFAHLNDGVASYSFYDSQSAGRAVSPAQLPILDGVDALVLGGISLIHRPAAGAFEALMQIAGPERLTVLDINIRPTLIDDEDAYRKRLDRMIAMADIVKLSDEDIDWLRPDPPEQLLAGRASLVLHTHGGQGATVYSRHGSQHLPASPVSVVDTVGAGDTFVAGLLASLARDGLLHPQRLATATRAPIVRATAYGMRAATFSVTRAGANPPTTKELQ